MLVSHIRQWCLPTSYINFTVIQVCYVQFWIYCIVTEIRIISCRLFSFVNVFDWLLSTFNFQQLLNNLDRDLQYAIKVEGKMDLESVSNYDEVKNAIMEKVLVFSSSQ